MIATGTARIHDVIGLVPTDHLNPTHDEVVNVVKSSLVDAGIAKGKIRLAQGGPSNPKKCDSLIALPALKAHSLTGIGTVMKLYIARPKTLICVTRILLCFSIKLHSREGCIL